MDVLECYQTMGAGMLTWTFVLPAFEFSGVLWPRCVIRCKQLVVCLLYTKGVSVGIIFHCLLAGDLLKSTYSWLGRRQVVADCSKLWLAEQYRDCCVCRWVRWFYSSGRPGSKVRPPEFAVKLPFRARFMSSCCQSFGCDGKEQFYKITSQTGCIFWA